MTSPDEGDKSGVGRGWTTLTPFFPPYLAGCGLRSMRDGAAVGMVGRTDTLLMGQRSQVNNVNTALLPAMF